MVAETQGQKYSFSKFNAQNQGIFYIYNVDGDNQELRVKLRIGSVLTECKVDTSAV